MSKTIAAYFGSLSRLQLASLASLILLVLVAAAYAPTAQNELGFNLKRMAHFAGYASLLAGMLFLTSNGRILRSALALLIIADLLVRLTYGDHLSIAVWMSILHASSNELGSFISENLLFTSASLVIVAGILLLPKVSIPPKVGAGLLAIGLAHTFLPLFTDPSLEDGISDNAAASKPAQLKYKALGFDRPTSYFFHYADSMGYRTPLSESLVGMAKTIMFFSAQGSSDRVWNNVRQRAAAPSLMVLVLGESLRADHLGLYGYQRETTPRLQARRPTLQVAHQAYAGGANTWSALPAMLTKVAGSRDYGLSIVRLAQAAGYKVHWLSNQVRFDNWGASIAQIADQADVQEFIAKDDDNQPLDEALLPILEHSLKDRKPGEKTLVVLHMIGSHFLFQERFPEAFAKFSAIKYDDEKKSVIAAYDDSIRYADYFVDQIIEKITPLGGELMFVADHGVIDAESDLYLRHDIRTPPALQSLRVPLLYHGTQTDLLRNDAIYNLFKFECLIAEWAMISAQELDANNHCQDVRTQDSVTFFDAKMTLQVKTVPQPGQKAR